MPDCLFCKIIAGDVAAAMVYEDGAVVAFLDINPINPGHTLVVPRAHYENLLATPDDALAKLMSAIKKIAPAVLKAVGSEGFNLGVNTGSVSGQAVFHTHFHIMPRHADDGHTLWHGKPYAEGEKERVGEMVRQYLMTNS